jgi:hypothetical protein
MMPKNSLRDGKNAQQEINDQNYPENVSSQPILPAILGAHHPHVTAKFPLTYKIAFSIL